jgi:hypothetical protein
LAVGDRRATPARKTRQRRRRRGAPGLSSRSLLTATFRRCFAFSRLKSEFGISTIAAIVVGLIKVDPVGLDALGAYLGAAELPLKLGEAAGCVAVSPNPPPPVDHQLDDREEENEPGEDRQPVLRLKAEEDDLDWLLLG